MNDLYGQSVPSVALPTQLSNSDKPSFNRVSKAFEKAAEWLHAKKAFTPEMLSEPEPLALMNATHDILAEELGHLGRNIPDAMARALDENIFLFSGFKTYHEMNDASRLLRDDDGGFKSFDRFLQDVQAIDSTYNQNWLYAEYNFATASTQMAAKWADIERDGDEYDLQYRTALDGLVREEHAALEGITLPPSDKFWNEYYPPNGWNCRCTAVQVLKDKYPTSDSDQACAAGERATTQIGKNGENKAAMFRFNSGKAEKVFPPKHPYFKAPKQVRAIVMTIMPTDVSTKEEKEKTAEAVKEAKKQIPAYTGISVESKGFETGKVTVLRRSLQDIFEHGLEYGGVCRWLQSFDAESLKSMEYKGWAPNRPYPEGHPKFDPANPTKSKHDTDTEYFLYYTIKIGKRDYWVNVKMHKDYGELVYTIEKEKPEDLIEGHKKK